MAVGKINDIFAGRGITETVHTKSNMDGVDKTVEVIRLNREGLVFTNLVDFDSSFGHRNDPAGYAGALEELDSRLPEIMDSVGEEQMLIITADHGCDPTFPHTDHTREYVPLLVYGKKVNPADLGTRETFADLGATVARLLGAPALAAGTDFGRELGIDK